MNRQHSILFFLYVQHRSEVCKQRLQGFTILHLHRTSSNPHISSLTSLEYKRGGGSANIIKYEVITYIKTCLWCQGVRCYNCILWSSVFLRWYLINSPGFRNRLQTKILLWETWYTNLQNRQFFILAACSSRRFLGMLSLSRAILRFRKKFCLHEIFPVERQSTLSTIAEGRLLFTCFATLWSLPKVAT